MGYIVFSGGQSEPQGQQLSAEGGLLQTCAEDLAGIQRGGEAADQQAAGQVGHRLNQTDIALLFIINTINQ